MDKEKLKLALEEGLLLKQEKENLEASKEKKRKEKEEKEISGIIASAKVTSEVIISELDILLKEAIKCNKNEIPLFCLDVDYINPDEKKNLYKTKVKEFLDEELSKLNVKSFVRHLEWEDVNSEYPRYCSRDDLCIDVSDLIESINDG